MKTKKQIKKEIVIRNMPEVKGGIENLSEEELARWLCLVEGVDIIYNKFEEMEMPANIAGTKKYIKRIDRALGKYIKERFVAMLSDVRFEKAKGQLA